MPRLGLFLSVAVLGSGFLPTSIATSVSQSANRCFETTRELYDAVDAYLLDPSEDTEVAVTYGWPIGTWCVDNIMDFDALFSSGRNRRARQFNEDISGWNVDRATTMNRMFLFAGSFDQDLCEWRDSVDDSVSVNLMFRGTSCRFRGAPSLESFCSACELPTGMPSTPPPSVGPTSKPSARPTAKPSEVPTFMPSDIPSRYPTEQPSGESSVAPSKSRIPTQSPSTLDPTSANSAVPTATSAPSSAPTLTPSPTLTCPYKILDFDDLSHGEYVTDQFEDDYNVTIRGRAREGYGEPRILFYPWSVCITCSGGDVGEGDGDGDWPFYDFNILILQDYDISYPEPSAGGGFMEFSFAEPVALEEVTLFLIYENGSNVRVETSDGNTFWMPVPAADWGESVPVAIHIDNVSTLRVNFSGRGAVVDLKYFLCATHPSIQPEPSVGPTSEPSVRPTAKPSEVPTFIPSDIPSRYPTDEPLGESSIVPSESRIPTQSPSTLDPTSANSAVPTATSAPSSAPTLTPIPTLTCPYQILDFDDLSPGEYVTDQLEEDYNVAIIGRANIGEGTARVLFNQWSPCILCSKGGVGEGGGLGMSSADEDWPFDDFSMLIIQDSDKDYPEPSAGGGFLEFQFTQPVALEEVTFLSMTYEPSFVTVRTSDGNTFRTLVPFLEEGEFIPVSIRTDNVATLRVDFHALGAVVDLKYFLCAQNWPIPP